MEKVFGCVIEVRIVLRLSWSIFFGRRGAEVRLTRILSLWSENARTVQTYEHEHESDADYGNHYDSRIFGGNMRMDDLLAGLQGHSDPAGTQYVDWNVVRLLDRDFDQDHTHRNAEATSADSIAFFR